MKQTRSASVKERLGLIQACGVNQVILRFVNSVGNLCEHSIEISNIPADMFDSGISLEDHMGTSTERNIVTVFPDRHSAWMNPFQDQPSLALLCYLQPVDASGGEGPATANLLSSAFMNPFFSPSPSMAPPHLMLASPAPSIYENPKREGVTVLATPTSSGSTSSAFTPQKTPIMMTPTAPLLSTAPSPLMPRLTMESTREKETSVSRRKHAGTSCHQCKNARPPEKLAYCNRLFDKRSGSDKRLCRKKYCAICLTKFYNDDVDSAQKKPNWVCPSCTGQCQCAACQRRFTRKRHGSSSDIGFDMSSDLHMMNSTPSSLMDLAEKSLMDQPGNR